MKKSKTSFGHSGSAKLQLLSLIKLSGYHGYRYVTDATDAENVRLFEPLTSQEAEHDSYEQLFESDERYGIACLFVITIHLHVSDI